MSVVSSRGVQGPPNYLVSMDSFRFRSIGWEGDRRGGGVVTRGVAPPQTFDELRLVKFCGRAHISVFFHPRDCRKLYLFGVLTYQISRRL